ncbi:AAA family ATPase [Patescibacteria group bacterium]|nr:AAA family ATPase [Patescibacteria group bacterium]
MLRYQWTRDYFADNSKVVVRYLNCEGMPDKEEADREVSKFWAGYLKTRFPNVDVIFSSEKYGDFVAEYMEIDHLSFDEARAIQQVSGTKIRNNPFKYRNYIPKIVQPYFVKKVCIVGAESTGKSTLTKRLAEYYNSTFVHEVGRELCPENSTCSKELL